MTASLDITLHPGLDETLQTYLKAYLQQLVNERYHIFCGFPPYLRNTSQNVSIAPSSISFRFSPLPNHTASYRDSPLGKFSLSHDFFLENLLLPKLRHVNRLTALCPDQFWMDKVGKWITCKSSTILYQISH